MRGLAAVLLLLAACGEPRLDASERPDTGAASRAGPACSGGGAQPDCDAARQALAEARRRERMAAYEQAF